MLPGSGPDDASVLTLSSGLKCQAFIALRRVCPPAVVDAGLCSGSTRRLQSSRRHFMRRVCVVISLAGEAALRLSAMQTADYSPLGV